MDHGKPLSINTKSRLAIKQHADIIRKMDHCLQRCSGMDRLCSGPNTRYRLNLGIDEAMSLVQVEQGFKVTYV